MAGKRRGPPPWQPTAKQRETVKMMTAYGIPQAEIATLLGITRPTLEKRCRIELDIGLAEANAAVAASMYRMATRGPYSVRFQAARYWLSARAQWRDGDKATILVPMTSYEMTQQQLEETIARDEQQHRAHERGEVVPFRPPHHR